MTNSLPHRRPVSSTKKFPMTRTRRQKWITPSNQQVSRIPSGIKLDTAPAVVPQNLTTSGAIFSLNIFFPEALRVLSRRVSQEALSSERSRFSGEAKDLVQIVPRASAEQHSSGFFCGPCVLRGSSF